MKNIIEREVDGILTDILDDYKKERAIDKNDIYNQPDKNEIIAILDHLMAIVYPGFFREKSHKIYNLSHTVSTLIEDVLFHLNKQIMVVMKYTKAFSEEQEEELEEFTQNASVAFLKTIPKIREYLDTDLQAALDGDPAASSKEEIIFSYPGRRHTRFISETVECMENMRRILQLQSVMCFFPSEPVLTIVLLVI